MRPRQPCRRLAQPVTCEANTHSERTAVYARRASYSCTPRPEACGKLPDATPELVGITHRCCRYKTVGVVSTDRHTARLELISARNTQAMAGPSRPQSHRVKAFPMACSSRSVDTKRHTQADGCFGDKEPYTQNATAALARALGDIR